MNTSATAGVGDAADLRRIIETALAEDAPWGDLTSDALIPATATATAKLNARESGRLSGIGVFAAVFAAVDPTIIVRPLAADGEAFLSGQLLALIEGPARAVLTAERVALNLTQRMCGIATLTAAFVTAVEGVTSAAGNPTRIADTRKTTPGLRSIERQAVRDGGGHNHRRSLSDAVMAKDNHLAVLVSQGLDVTTALRQARERLPHTTHVVVEVDRLDQIVPVIRGGAQTVLLDNFTIDELRQGVRQIAGKAVAEASGGVNLETVRSIAETGVDVISVGALTHSARALDLGLDVTISA
ncbi:MAG TPA: carboxylating nicotinate-nucleotide diphosphorylase [Candidatus Lumbricidophila sp.]|nr:carboxylating nicotinate-nucleotide diphosphorylase [Candidatus Lumbricidophila sp.]